MSEFEVRAKEIPEFKKVAFGDVINTKVKEGIDILAKAVAITLGPNGKNVIIKKNFDKIFTKDGVTVARNIDFEDKYMSLGAKLVKEAAIATAAIAGDGTTCSTILVHQLINKGLEKIKNGARVDNLAKQIEDDKEVIINHLKETSRLISSPEEVVNIASISANDRTLGEIIGGIYNQIGKEGNIVVEESKTNDTTYEVVDGLRFNSGYVSPWFMTNARKEKSELENPAILITDLDINSFQPFIRILNELIAADVKGLLIVGSKISGEALLGFIQNHQRKIIRICAVEAPLHGLERERFLDDFALLTGGKLISRDSGIKLEHIGQKYFGKAKKVIVDRKNTIIVGGDGAPEEIKDRIMALEADYEKSKEKHLKERISRLNNKVAVLRVGGATQLEVEEKKYRIEDATESTRIALEDGIVPGGEIALINAARQLPKDSLVKIACEEPFNVLIRNIDKNPKDFIKKVGGTIGYDAKNEIFVDMYEAGIIDPVKVPITALENAVSVAINFLKSRALVFNIVDLNQSIDEPLEI